MTDLTRSPEIRDDAGVEPHGESASGTSRWQKVVGTIGLLVLLALGVRMFGAAGGHGSGDQGPGGQQEQDDTDDGGGHVPPPAIPDHG